MKFYIQYCYATGSQLTFQCWWKCLHLDRSSRHELSQSHFHVVNWLANKEEYHNVRYEKCSPSIFISCEREPPRYTFFFTVYLYFQSAIWYLHSFLTIFKSSQVEFTRKFKEATSCHVIKINSLESDRKFPIVHAERSITKFGLTVLLSVKYSPFNLVEVFMPKCYSSAFADDDIDSINSLKVSPILIYKGTWMKSNSCILATEQ